MSEDRVRITVADHVATVTMVRADKHNALDQAMFDGLIAAAAEAGSTSGVRVVILHGEGPSFCSGIDIGWLGAQAGSPDAFSALDGPVPNLFQNAAHAWIDCPVPVIAAIHGNCFGGGAQIALGADLRIAAPDARISIMETRWGLVPDMSITRTLTRLVAIDVAKELVFTARRLSGSEAKAIGLVTALAEDPLAGARDLAAQIAARSPHAIRAAKRLLDEGWDGPAEATLRLEAELQKPLMGSPNMLAAIMAGATGETPEFVDP